MGELQRQTAAGQSERMHSELSYKRLENGRFIWPVPADGVVGISAAQLAYMLDGIDWRNPRQTFRPACAG
jgi:transposase